MARPKIRDKREAALNDLAKVITAIYGERCDRHEATCYGCAAWASFDLVERMTETCMLDEKFPKDLMR